MKIKKLLCILICLVMVISVFAACTPKNPDNSGDGNGDGTGNNGGVTGGLTSDGKNPKPDHNNYTTVRLNCYLGGVGIEWLYGSLTRFQEKYKDHSFEPGKKGIYVEVSTQSDEGTSQQIGSLNYHIMIDERNSDIFSLAGNGLILPVTDVLKSTVEDTTSIESRLKAEILEGIKGIDGEYYALPNYELFPGLAYDREAFSTQRWYLAKDAANGNLFESNYGDAYFIKTPDSAKSCGPDGVYDTDDDGLPSSLEELMIVCAKVKRTGYPLTFSGQWPQNCNYFVQGLWASLAGAEELATLYTFDGEAEVVTGFTTENLFEGIDYVKKPITEKVRITEENGYLAHSTAARYYAASFIQIAYKEGWFSPESTQSTGNVEAMTEFVMSEISGTPRAFLIEGNYWYNEVGMDSDTLEDYTALSGNEYRDVAWMSLPMEVHTADVEIGTKKVQTLMDNGITYMYLNAKFKDNADIIKASKMILEYLLCDKENVEFTKKTGLTRPINYTLSEDELSSLSLFHRSSYNLAKTSNVVYNSSASSIFKKNAAALQISFSCTFFKPAGNNSYFDYFRKTGKSSQDLFNLTKLSALDWEGMANK